MEENKKNNTGLIVFLVILVLGLAGYICYDKFYKKESVKPEVKDQPKTTDKGEEDEMKPSNLTIDELEEIIIEEMPHGWCAEYEMLYQEKGFNMKDFPEDYLLDWLFFNVGDLNLDEEKDTTITLDKIQKALDKLVLNAPTVTIEKLKNSSYVDENQEDDYYEIGDIKYKIVDNNSIKAHYIVSGCDDPLGYAKKIIDSYENADKLIINTKVAYFEGDGEIVYTQKAFFTSKYLEGNIENNAVEKLNVPEDGFGSEKDLNFNWNLYDTYKITFTKSNGNYYLDSVNIVK